MKLGQVRPATQANRFYTGDAEELENDPYLYKLYFEKSVYNFSENLIVKLRLLPYPEEANWSLDEEKVLDIPPKIGMGWDKINRLGDYYKEEE